MENGRSFSNYFLWNPKENPGFSCRLIFLLGSLWFSPSFTFAILKKMHVLCYVHQNLQTADSMTWSEFVGISEQHNCPLFLSHSPYVLSFHSIHPSLAPNLSHLSLTQQYVEQEVRVIFGFYLRSFPTRRQSLTIDRWRQNRPEEQTWFILIPSEGSINFGESACRDQIRFKRGKTSRWSL